MAAVITDPTSTDPNEQKEQKEQKDLQSSKEITQEQSKEELEQFQKELVHISTLGCPHLESLKSSDPVVRAKTIQNLTTAFRWSYRQRSKSLWRNSKVKPPSTICAICHNALSRPFICFQCRLIAGWKDGHMKDHLCEFGHSFAIDLSSGDLFCMPCNDFIYDGELLRIKHSIEVQYNEDLARDQEPTQKRARYQEWNPTEQELTVFDSGYTKLPCQNIRGLRNMGATCFMNSILQTLIHNPLLRNFFLADKHNSQLCNIKDCMCCEMDNLFMELYSNDKAPYGPTSFLLSMWQSSVELAGYAQQDAHEFFISAINQIHANSKGSTNVSCNCIIHTTFAGSLQSDVTCLRCGNVSTAVDPIVDISLDLRVSKKKSGIVGYQLQGNGTSAAASPFVEAGGDDSARSSPINGKSVNASTPSQQKNGASDIPQDEIEHFTTLVECLERYTRAERLGPNQYNCSKCGNTFQEATKQLSLLKLPSVICFQLKRFEHLQSAQKIEDTIRFPLILNMLPYTSSAKKRGVSIPQGETHTSYIYDLFGVVNHQGQMNTGHYTTFCKVGTDWFKFDDHMVTLATQEQVLESKAYMCFYIKRVLDYESTA